MVKKSNQEHDSKVIIADSGTTSYMVNLEENTTNLKNSKTRFTVGDRKTTTVTKRGD